MSNKDFKKKYDQFTNYLDITIPFTKRFTIIADWVMKKYGYSFIHFKSKKFEKFAAYFSEVYNDAWSGFEIFAPIKYETIKESFRQIKPIIDEKILWFAYYKDKPIAFVVSLPDINPIIKKVNGKLNLISKLKFFWYKKMITAERLRMVIMGCKNRFQKKALNRHLSVVYNLKYYPEERQKE